MGNHIGDGIRALTSEEVLYISGGTTAHGLGEGGGTGTGTGLGNLGELIRGVGQAVVGALEVVWNSIPFH